MANGNGSDRARLADIWRSFDDNTKLDLIIAELDRLHDKIDRGFRQLEARQTRSLAFLYTIIGGVVVGLVLLVAQLAAS